MGQEVDGMHAATSKVESSAQGSSFQLKFIHGCMHPQAESVVML